MWLAPLFHHGPRWLKAERNARSSVSPAFRTVASLPILWAPRSTTSASTRRAASASSPRTATRPTTNNYGYDALDRLTEATLPASSFGYGYDAVGNRVTRTARANTDIYVYGAASNRVGSITPASGPVRSFAFDANGSTTADGTNQYAYDTRGRLVQATTGRPLHSFEFAPDQQISRFEFFQPFGRSIRAILG